VVTKRDSRDAARRAIAEQKKAEARRRSMIMAGSGVGIVILVVGIIVAAFLLTGTKKTPVAPATVASQSLIAQVTGVPAATLDTIGKGTATAPTAQTGTPVKTADGKPLVFYFGAEFCPYCAAERWAIIVALSRFGTFSNVSQIYSSEDNIPTFTFEGSSYTSQYITFQPTEVEDQNAKPLDKLTADQQQIVSTYNTSGTFPFVSIGNQAIISGASYDNSVLKGQTQAEVAAALQDPTTAIAKGIGGTANAITASICKLTNNQPTDVCSSKAVQAFNG
jgi:thiol-disulfide isomerase/thioredoxin